MTHYVIVRADLPRGIQAAQLLHGAGESSPGNLPSGTHAIALTVPNEVDLWRLADSLKKASVEHVLIIESDSPYTDQLMAIGVSPRRKEELKKYFSQLPLLK